MSDRKEKLKPFLYPLAFVVLAALSLAYKLFMNGSSSGFISSVRGEGTGAFTSESCSAIESGYDCTGMSGSALPGGSAATAEDSAVTDNNTGHMISVYICGEVNNPGVYEVSAGTILNDVAELAGGFTPGAELTRINLVYEIYSNMSVYIPSEENLEDTGNLGDLQDDVIREDDSVCVWGDSQSSGEDGSGGQAALSGHTGTVNINTASREELMMLPGIGDVISSAIIQYREKTPFVTIDDIRNVTGIGDAKFDRIKALITV